MKLLRCSTQLLVVTATALLACGGKAKPAEPAEPAFEGGVITAPEASALPPLPAIPATPQAAPEALLGVAIIGDPLAQLSAVTQLVNTVQAGAGALLNPQMLDQAMGAIAGVGALQGVDYARPVRFIALDPKVAPEPLILVFGVADEALLQQSLQGAKMRVQVHGGYAALGSTEALTAGAPYALTTFVNEPPPAQPTAILSISALQRRYASELEMMIPQMQMALAASGQTPQQAEAMAQAYAELLRQLDRLVITIEPTATEATITYALVPQANSSASAFLANHPPLSLEHVASLPSAPIVMVANADWKRINEVSSSLMPASQRELYTLWYDMMIGNVAIAFDVENEKLSFAGFSGIRDAGEYRKLMAALPKALEKVAPPEMPMTFRFKPQVFSHRGVRVSALTVNTSDAQQQAMLEKIVGSKEVQIFSGAMGTTLISTMGNDAKPRLKSLIDASRGKKATVSPLLQAPLQAAMERGENFLALLDLNKLLAVIGKPVPAGMVAAPVELGMKLAPEAATVRFTVPASAMQMVVPLIMAQAMGG